MNLLHLFLVNTRTHTKLLFSFSPLVSALIATRSRSSKASTGGENKTHDPGMTLCSVNNVAVIYVPKVRPLISVL